MSSLHELQQEFARALQAENNHFLHSIHASNKLSAQQHFNIYEHSVTGARQKTLKEIFSVCCKLVGEEFFIGMINIYISQTKSTSYDIGEFGENFPDFIATFTPAKSLPYLSDVTRLEWAWHKIYSAPDNSDFDFQKLTSASENIIFSPPIGSYLIASPYPIHRIWETNQDNYSGDQTIILETNIMYYFLVWRKRLELRADPLTFCEWQILSWMQQRFTLGEICEKITENALEIDIVTLLPQLISNGWVLTR